MFKRKIAVTLIAATAILCTLTAPAYAGSWQQDGNGWWYANDDGTYPVSSWAFLDGAWYHFNNEGYMDTGWLYDNNPYANLVPTYVVRG